jgi:hypothetical protein
MVTPHEQLVELLFEAVDDEHGVIDMCRQQADAIQRAGYVRIHGNYRAHPETGRLAERIPDAHQPQDDRRMWFTWDWTEHGLQVRLLTDDEVANWHALTNPNPEEA